MNKYNLLCNALFCIVLFCIWCTNIIYSKIKKNLTKNNLRSNLGRECETVSYWNDVILRMNTSIIYTWVLILNTFLFYTITSMIIPMAANRSIIIWPTYSRLDFKLSDESNPHSVILLGKSMDIVRCDIYTVFL